MDTVDLSKSNTSHLDTGQEKKDTGSVTKGSS